VTSGGGCLKRKGDPDRTYCRPESNMSSFLRGSSGKRSLITEKEATQKGGGHINKKIKKKKERGGS